eukprot:gnl/MRDRNA2_/MRDRNA2_29191_c0_seq1.p1 gnl/MRDRNA2_/MRDRNA2_29191_c0~~gnl/MRDRNA2_/MRDRNA2_29191_c0_seq1.p1  ORF type:complete len:449 (+),score=86.24 gnl/MRDRNA2_/MRDRNA2_29191_c0_seq1:72-1418(+)
MSPAPAARVQPGALLDGAEDVNKSDDSAFAEFAGFHVENGEIARFEAAPPKSPPRSSQSIRKVAYDECTIRMMFIEMDANANGVATKEEFIDFVRSRPQLQNVMYNGLKPEAAGEQDESKPSPQSARAMGIKRIMTLYKDMDKNKNGVVTWNEFIDFFRRTDLLITYSTPENPRDRMASTLATEYQRRIAINKCQSNGQKLVVAQQEGCNQPMECTKSKFLSDQEQQKLNTQWAAEKLVQLQEQSSCGRDALSIAQDSVNTMRQSARMVVGRSEKKSEKSAVNDEQPDSAPDAPQAEMPSPAQKIERKVVIHEQPHSTKDARQVIWINRPKAATCSHTGRKLTVSSPSTEPTCCKSDGDTGVEQVSPLSLPLKLPTLLEQQPHGVNCKSPFRRKGRSRSTVCQKTSTEDHSKTPRHHKRKGDSASPSKRGRTPRRRADRCLTTSLLCP